MATSAFGQDTEITADPLRQRTSEAVRLAANRVADSVVMIEVIGASDAASGDIQQDAPTSAVVVDSQGHLIASELIAKRAAASILVILPDGQRQTATVVARDTHRKLVLLKTKPSSSMKPIGLERSVSAPVGTTTIAVGRYGGDASLIVSTGVLSADQRLDGIALQCDARVTASLYGGALIDLRGQFLGVLIAAVSEGGAPEDTSWYDSGIAFAIPADVIREKLDRLKAGETVQKGFMGIVPKSGDPLASDTTIAAVRANSPAEKVGIEPGDRVISVAGRPVRRHQVIQHILGRYVAGDSIPFKIRRGDSETVEFRVTLIDTIPPVQPQRLGIIAAQPDSTENAKADTPPTKEGADDKNGDVTSGVEIAMIVPGTPASEALAVGDRITRWGGSEVEDAESLRRLLTVAEPDAEVVLSVVRGGELTEFTLRPDGLAGVSLRSLPAEMPDLSEQKWDSEDIALADAKNKASLYYPAKTPSSNPQIGLLVLLANPGQREPEKASESWQTAARASGTMVLTISSENEKGWQPKELDVVARMAQLAMKRQVAAPRAVAVAAVGAVSGRKPTASDAMAIACAVANSDVFHGLAVSHQSRPPGIRLSPGDSTKSAQVLLPIDDADDIPAWGAALQQGGYPIVLGGKVSRRSILVWTRLLQSI
ncbi:MAG: PDZ domain-containing protein [Planctomycetota bacterium]